MSRISHSTWRVLGGALLLVVAGFGVIHGLRASLAQARYYRIKYLAPDLTVSVAHGLGESAHRLYPHNYRLSVLLADRAFQAYERGGDESVSLLQKARLWCDRGLEANPIFPGLVYLDTELMALTSLDAAIARWEGFLDWQFWEPYNHAYLVSLYVRAGRLAQAAEQMEWVRGSEYQRWAGGLLRDAWEQELELMRRY